MAKRGLLLLAVLLLRAAALLQKVAGDTVEPLLAVADPDFWDKAFHARRRLAGLE